MIKKVNIDILRVKLDYIQPTIFLLLDVTYIASFFLLKRFFWIHHHISKKCCFKNNFETIFKQLFDDKTLMMYKIFLLKRFKKNTLVMIKIKIDKIIDNEVRS